MVTKPIEGVWEELIASAVLFIRDAISKKTSGSARPLLWNLRPGAPVIPKT